MSSSFPSVSMIRSLMKRELDPNAAFPAMLHRMLTDIDELSERDDETGKLNTIVSWIEDGTAFRIHDKKRFISIIMPVWFIRLKYTSFIRQLNAYNFRRINDEGPMKGAIYHEKFLKDYPELTMEIEKGQKKGKGNCGRAQSPRTTTNAVQAPVLAFAENDGRMQQADTRTSFAQPDLKQLQSRAVSQDSLARLMIARGSRSGMPSAHEHRPATQGAMHNSEFQPLLVPEPTRIPIDHDPFGGLTWNDPEEEYGLGRQNAMENMQNSQAVFGGAYNQNGLPSNNLCNELEPVPISPHLDMLHQHFNQPYSNRYQSGPASLGYS